MRLWRMFRETGRWNYLIRTGTKQKDGRGHWCKADLAFADIKLDVEIDGGVHRIPAAAAKDIRRTVLLESLGWTVLRFSTEEVMTDLERVKAVIESTISRLRATQAIPQTA